MYTVVILLEKRALECTINSIRCEVSTVRYATTMLAQHDILEQAAYMMVDYELIRISLSD
jgi:hypothetical protein